jgi:hypothetical protein
VSMSRRLCTLCHTERCPSVTTLGTVRYAPEDFNDPPKVLGGVELPRSDPVSLSDVVSSSKSNWIRANSRICRRCFALPLLAGDLVPIRHSANQRMSSSRVSCTCVMSEAKTKDYWIDEGREQEIPQPITWHSTSFGMADYCSSAS